ncbi:hypothetical protein IPF37_00735 [bacterium]|nr:MAG: hypothetical protein IPF37_00735 [bacterium]
MKNLTNKASSLQEALFISNETYIHPTAIVDKTVQLDYGVKIGPFCIITGNVKIEAGSRLYANVSVGMPAEDTNTKKSLGSVLIKKNCEIREFATIHASKYPDGTTTIGNNCYIMNYAHISHDGTLEDNVILINGVSLGGHTYLEKNVMMMAHSATHQFCRIGKYSALAPFSGIRQDLPPFCLYSGGPAAFAGLNRVALRRAGFTADDINNIKAITRLFFQEKLLLEDIEKKIALEPWGADQHIQDFLAFVRTSQRGVSRRSLEK